MDKSHLLLAVLLGRASGAVYSFAVCLVVGIVALHTMSMLSYLLLQVKIVSNIFAADVQNATIGIFGGRRNRVHGGQDFVVVFVLGDDLVRSVHLCDAHYAAPVAIFKSRPCQLTALLVHCHFLHHLISPLVDVWVARAPLHSLDAV